MLVAGVVDVVVVHIGLNPRKTLLLLRSGKHIGAGERRERVKRFEEREMARRVLAVPPMASWFPGSVLFYSSVGGWGVDFYFLQPPGLWFWGK